MGFIFQTAGECDKPTAFDLTVPSLLSLNIIFEVDLTCGSVGTSTNLQPCSLQFDTLLLSEHIFNRLHIKGTRLKICSESKRVSN